MWIIKSDSHTGLVAVRLIKKTSEWMTCLGNPVWGRPKEEKEKKKGCFTV